MDKELERKMKVYSTVQKIIQNLAAGQEMKPFTGKNMFRNQEELDLFTNMFDAMVPGDERHATPIANRAVQALTGMKRDPWDSARKLRVPRIEEGRRDVDYTDIPWLDRGNSVDYIY